MIEVHDRYVYAIDDENGEPCYIGAGKGNRLNIHAYYALANKPKSNLTRNLIEWRARGFEPISYKVAEDLTISQALSYERFLVAWYGRRDIGTGNLLNACAGGSGIKHFSASTRARLSAKAKREWMDPNRKYKARRGFKLSDEQKASLIKACVKAVRGKKLTAETKAKLSAAHSTPEARARKSAVHRGRIVFPETKAKMKAAHLARSPEARIAQRARRARERESRAIKQMSLPLV